MNFSKANRTLCIREEYNFSERVVKKQYTLMALKYHPYKNKSSDATKKYPKIKEAYDYLMKHLKTPRVLLDKEEESSDEDETSTHEETSVEEHHESWKSSVSLFVETFYLYRNEPCDPLMTAIIETNDATIFESMDAIRASKIFAILVRFAEEGLVLPYDFLCKAYATIKSATGKTAEVLLPKLADAIYNGVYSMNLEDGETLSVPFWHREFIHNNYIVRCEPRLQPNVELDGDNNIHVYLTFEMRDLWTCGETTLEYYLDGYERSIQIESLNIKREQVVVLKGEGMPLVDKDDKCNYENKADVHLHITLW